MIVRCPACGAGHAVRYRIGRAPRKHRCSNCHEVFAYLPALELEPAGASWGPRRLPSAEPNGTVAGAGAPDSASALDPEHPAQPPRPLPLEPAPQPRSAVAARLLGLAAGLALIALLFAQFLVHERDRLGPHPELRALSDTICAHLPCTDTVSRVPGAVRVEGLQFVPVAPGVLRIDLELLNTLEQPQPWPLLEIALSDRHGRVLAQARWHPDEFLGAAADPRLEPQERRALRLDVRGGPRRPEGVMVWPL
ncbi:zinc-ribbon and DUF3426 domain-containing protein [Thioalkalivibrio paradoxus]|uniref:Zinc finger/thioredoxin putative domain-containing protein n=1 Tax=Thioalkalivibrio paradoxus ARh 1 TaxID=713585 RepID=W0DTT5_9GAMM|nr:zinc-ribbon and DUF3426 domain-containing protein [Thioalkalivibrio paradoxus]AHF00281.1 hypothetical protein THITH_15335 [Thioalkalivibrio paradoxus ARh 1]